MSYYSRLLFKLQLNIGKIQLPHSHLFSRSFKNSNFAISVQNIKLRSCPSGSRSQVKTILFFCALLVIAFSTTLSIFSDKANQVVKSAEAMSFKSGWNSTINSISTSSHKINTSEPKFSYINPYFEYPNLNKSYQNDPQHTNAIIDKIRQYIKENSSRDSFDAEFNSPVNAEQYLETAIKYHVPIDQMLAVARSESRFGTDCYTSNGSMTRICIYKNIFSIGLTESSSIGFKTWNEGVDAFGRLYQNRKDRGFDDCGIWRIYNPNGDYCSKIFDLANKITIYLDNQ
jgi:hypothetical protein